MKASIFSLASFVANTVAITHPGLLHTNKDFERIQGYVKSGVEPQLTGWNKLVARTNPNYQPQAADVVCRGASWCSPQNFPLLYRDAHSAYVNAIYWKVTGDTAYADAAARTLDAWSSTLTLLTGSNDLYLVAGIQGYQLANAAEILREYQPWKGLQATVNMLQTHFLMKNAFFLETHNHAAIDHYWANWGLSQLASLHAIGVLSDNQTAINQAYDVFKHGEGNEALEQAIWKIHSENEDGTGKLLGQGNESGRDQGHTLLDYALLGTFAQQAWNQGEDLFGLLQNRILAGSEYASKYNLGHDVPYEIYTWSGGSQTVIGADGRGGARPWAELMFAHYDGIKGLDAGWTKAYRDFVNSEGSGAEGGGGDYGPNSGGYDQLGFGTILFRLD